jgi:broad specificity phosphatase PhoE
MNYLYLVRHGENLANLTLEFSHRKVDYPLTPKGVLQAQQTAEALRSRHIDEIYSSPLKRALETAQIIAEPHRLPVTIIENFREVNVGDLEGQPPTTEAWNFHNAIVAGWMNGHPETYFPGGENLPMLIERTRQGLVDLLVGKSDRRIVIAAHGGIFTFTLPSICEPFDRSILRQGLANCSITEVAAEVVDGQIKARLISFGSKDHLSGEAANLVRGIPEEDKTGSQETRAN